MICTVNVGISRIRLNWYNNINNGEYLQANISKLTLPGISGLRLVTRKSQY